MAKGTPVKKLVNGEIADADDVNQIVEDVGSQGGSIPYDPTTNEQVVNGSQSLGLIAFPWGSLFANMNANLIEVDPVTNTASANVAWKNLRKFNFLKDTPSTYVGSGGLGVRVKVDETGLEFYQPSNTAIFNSSGSFTVPAGINVLYLTMLGGGAGGGGGGNNGVNNSSGGASGGAAGGYVSHYPYFVTPGDIITVTVGAGGAGGLGTLPAANTNTNGASGGTTSFGSVSVLGGGPGLTTNGDSGAIGGTSPSSTPTLNGQATGSPFMPFVAQGNGANGTADSGSTPGNGGNGGATYFGNGGAGSGTPGTPGSNATGRGAGGGGSNGGANNPINNGGAGHAGIVIIQY